MTFVTVACSNPSTSALSSLQDAICPATSHKYKGKEFSAKKKNWIAKGKSCKETMLLVGVHILQCCAYFMGCGNSK